ncbi:AaceriABR197Wp [[Ashbya] aceris (nom. inval.)]|nr:AaceriABR197Wp [[Ashbya] aceris (nom. inval.)]
MGSPTRYAPHLSEFYSIVNQDAQEGRQAALPQGDTGHEQALGLNKQANRSDVKRSMSLAESADSFAQLRRPSSIRSTTTSITDLQTLITKKDMVQTHDAMNQLVREMSEYALSLVSNATKASNVAFALENMAHLKGCNDGSADKFLNASGVFHLLSNHDRIIANLVTETLAPSLRDRIGAFGASYKTSELSFKKRLKEETFKLKLQEGYNIKLSKRKNRNLFSYRENLMNMQQQLDSIEALKHDYYQESYDLVEAFCQEVLKDIATLTRAQVEISENLARKGWSGGGLDDLIVSAEDPFSKNRSEEEESYQETQDSLKAYNGGVDSPEPHRSATPMTGDDTGACSNRNEETIRSASMGTNDRISERHVSPAPSTGTITVAHSSPTDINYVGFHRNHSDASVLVDYSFSLPLAGSKNHIHEIKSSSGTQQNYTSEADSPSSPAIDNTSEDILEAASAVSNLNIRHVGNDD